MPASEVKQLKAQIRELERLLGRKTQEPEILKEAVEIILARSNLLEQLRKGREASEPLPEPEPTEVTEAQETGQNAALLSRIRELVGVRPSYGYRRVTALLNHELSERVNPKRIYRIMKRNKLLLERCTGDGRGRKHDGVIMTLKPNLRWCSDSFEIRCWSGKRVNVAFVLDSCDREVTGFVAEAGPLCGEHVRDMMVQAVEHRFGPETRKLPASLQWLSDNGSIFTSDETRAFEAEKSALKCEPRRRIRPRATAWPNPSSRASNATTCTSRTSGPPPTCCETCPHGLTTTTACAPHKALRMLSPLEFRNAQLAS